MIILRYIDNVTIYVAFPENLSLAWLPLTAKHRASQMMVSWELLKQEISNRRCRISSINSMMPIVLSSRPFLTPRTWGSSMELAIYFHTGGSIAIPAHPMGERLHIQTEKKKTFQLQSWPTLIIVQTDMIHQVDPSVMLWEPFQNGG